ncbi:phosphate ABC transporter substrate-binding protein, PhoT family [Hoeflea sp. IMCC20628]|uniref:substrate-binding domain-containing protein n=1 Tax=Hoeflea sp. IMCC20628 TaxID=1620421 RepID=UPI00063AD9EC|nr:substrate-binding domain-containing protein [Hoeflea sp. IMCC20628]AKH98935.1 phosphate ABC transporter substrate-binding protein, PhoT family [Hoeflea sp. IMCC20628]
MTNPFLRASSSCLMATLTVCFAVLPVSAAETLRLGGTGSATVLVERLAAAFEASESGLKVQVIPGLGSSGGIAAAQDGALDIAVSARPLKPAETGLVEVVAVITPYGLVSSNSKPGDIANADVAAFFASTTSIWPDGSPVRIILRPKSESDTALLGQTFPEMAAAIDQVRTRIDVPLAATDQDNLEMAKAIDGSLVGTSLAQMVTEQHQSELHFLTIDGVQPTLENLENGTYPYFKPFRFVHAENPEPQVERFLAFVGSSEGKSLLREAGSLPAAQ